MTVQLGLYFSGQLPLDGSWTAREEYESILDLSVEAERLGFDAIWLTEHHFAADSYLPSILPMLSAIAAKTESIRLGAGVILAPFHAPIRLAEDAIIVDLVSGGRLELGLGIAWRNEEFRAMGVPRNDRVPMTEDALAVLRNAFRGDRFSYKGETIQVEDVLIRPQPEREIPVWIAALADVGIARAGRIADGYVGGFSTAEEFGRRLGILDEAAQERGIGPLPSLVLLYGWVGTPSEAVLRGAWHAIDMYKFWHAESDTAQSPLTEMPSREPDEIPPLMLYGAAERLAEQLQDYIDVAGDRDLTLCIRLDYPGVPKSEVMEAIRVFGKQVAPLVRAASS